MRCGTWAPGPVCVWIGQRGRLRLPARGKMIKFKLEITRLRETTRIRFVTKESK